MPGFDLGHLAAIFFVAFLVLGPQRMVEVARSLGKFSQDAQREWVKFNQAFQAGLNEPPTPPLTESTESAPADTAASSEAATDSAAISATAPADPAPIAASEPVPASTPAPSLATPTPVVKAKPKKKKPVKQPQSISDHLLDLRAALVRSIVAIVLLTTIAYIFSDTLLYILRAPAGQIKLVALSPMDGFVIKLRIALYGGLFLSAPIWIFEIMRFIAPALLPHEKRLIIPGIVAAMILFFLGNVFGYYMLSFMMSFIFTMFGPELQYFPSADPFISFVVFFLLAAGIAFELPIILLIFIRIGWLSPDTLRRQRKIVYFIIFVFAELITPVADPFIAPTIVMSPMIVLFELALLVARWVMPKRTATATQ